MLKLKMGCVKGDAMKRMTWTSAVICAVALVGGAEAQTRGTIRIVGSSTVFPFTTAAAENFGAITEFPTPVVEATGTGGGMNLFCAGVGVEHPDMTAASRRMKPSEFNLCQTRGVTQITEVLIGYDGIVIGNSMEAAPLDINKHDIFLALADRIPQPVNNAGQAVVDAQGRFVSGFAFSDIADYSCTAFVKNPFQRWSDISADLPTSRIEVYGPPPTSGTRDAFVELGLQQGAMAFDCMAQLYAQDRARFEEISSRIREDRAWIDAGENDNTVVQTLINSPSAFGVFGYSYLEQNADRIHGGHVDGVEPTYDAIAGGDYPISRSLYVYVKNQHVGIVPGIQEYIEHFTSEDAWGPFGYLAERGLIALTDEERFEASEVARALTPMAHAPEE